MCNLFHLHCHPAGDESDMWARPMRRLHRPLVTCGQGVETAAAPYRDM